MSITVTIAAICTAFTVRYIVYVTLCMLQYVNAVRNKVCNQLYITITTCVFHIVCTCTPQRVRDYSYASYALYGVYVRYVLSMILIACSTHYTVCIYYGLCALPCPYSALYVRYHMRTFRCACCTCWTDCTVRTSQCVCGYQCWIHKCALIF